MSADLPRPDELCEIDRLLFGFAFHEELHKALKVNPRGHIGPVERRAMRRVVAYRAYYEAQRANANAAPAKTVRA